MTDEISTVVREFRRKQRKRRVAFLIVLLGVMAATLAILEYAKRQALQAEAEATKQSLKAKRTAQTVEVYGDSLLERVTAIDQRAKELSHEAEPTAYLWRGGLRRKSGATQLTPADLELIRLLNEKKSLLSGVGPILGSSEALAEYVCNHIWYVVGQSFPTTTAEKALADEALRDPRFQLAGVGQETRAKGYAPILVGSFLTRDEADNLAKEIGVGSFDVRQWDFGQYQPTCSSGSAAPN